MFKNRNGCGKKDNSNLASLKFDKAVERAIYNGPKPPPPGTTGKANFVVNVDGNETELKCLHDYVLLKDMTEISGGYISSYTKMYCKQCGDIKVEIRKTKIDKEMELAFSNIK